MRKEKEMDLLMRKALASDMTPDADLNEEIIRKWDSRSFRNPAGNPDFGNEVKGMNKRKIASIAAAAAVFVLAVSTTAVGAVKYLTRNDIVSELGDDGMIRAYGGNETLELDETIEAGDYRFNLYGVTTAEGLMRSGLEEDIEKQGGTYVILSIERLDGEPMPDFESKEYKDFFISPLIQGLEPWEYNMVSMGGATATTDKEGVRYTIIQCDDIAVFADRQIYLCITESTFYEKDAYIYNETDGTITRNESYDGINILWDLPIDKNRADEEKALAYLAELEESWHRENEEPEIDENGIYSTDTKALDDVILKEKEKNPDITSLEDIPLETIISYGVLEENSVQEVTVGEDGTVYYSYESSDGSEAGTSFVDEDFLDGRTDLSLLGYSGSDDQAACWVCRRDEDGTVKAMMYVIGE